MRRTAVALVSLFTASPALAGGLFGPDPDESPSVFSYGFRGFGTGALVGLGAGYLIARGSDEGGAEDTKAVAYAVLGGALVGGVSGLVLGIVDVADDRPGVGNLVLRDTLYGALFGLAAGGLAGTAIAIESEDWETVPFAGAIGIVSGAALGVVVGVFEGRRIVDSPAHRRRAGLSGFAVAPFSDGDAVAWGPAFSGTF